MKYRRDFVTNSSSASFLIARKPELSDRQIMALGEFAADRLLGREIVSPGTSEEEFLKIADYEYWDEAYNFSLDDIREALKEGKTIYQGTVSYEGAGWRYASLFEAAWRVLVEAADDEHPVTMIDDDISI